MKNKTLVMLKPRIKKHFGYKYGVLHSMARKILTHRFFDGFIISLILANVVVLILSSDRTISRDYHRIFHFVEIFSAIVFITEYLCRIIAMEEMVGALSPMMIIDIVVIISFFFTFEIWYFRLIRVFKVFSMFRMPRYNKALKVIINVTMDKKEEILVVLVFFFVFLLISSSILYIFERGHQAALSTIPRAMWLVIITATGVGYGDIVPVTVYGKIVIGVISFFGIILCGLISSIYASGFLSTFNKNRYD